MRELILLEHFPRCWEASSNSSVQLSFNPNAATGALGTPDFQPNASATGALRIPGFGGMTSLGFVPYPIPNVLSRQRYCIRQIVAIFNQE
jgi:hypothetical protein